MENQSAALVKNFYYKTYHDGVKNCLDVISGTHTPCFIIDGERIALYSVKDEDTQAFVDKVVELYGLTNEFIHA